MTCTSFLKLVSRMRELPVFVGIEGLTSPARLS